LLPVYPKYNYIYAFITASATRMPSTAADIIPPAYPAPSPHGYIPFILDWKVLSLLILTGDEVLLSIPESSASSLEYPLIFLPNSIIPSSI